MSTVVEQLESRELFSNSFVVNSTLENVNDSDVSGATVTLREAINYANGRGATITFDPSLSGKTITLGGTQLELLGAITIDACALSGGITISGNNASRVFRLSTVPRSPSMA